MLQNYPKAGYLNFDDAAPLYEFVADQPQDTLTASLSRQADSLPSFTGRSVLVSREHALAYHTGYYDQMRQRVEALIQAQYTLDPAQVSAFIDRYDIDLWLLDAAAFEANYLAKKSLVTPVSTDDGGSDRHPEPVGGARGAAVHRSLHHFPDAPMDGARRHLCGGMGRSTLIWC